jgi:hypothetical protein
MYSRDKSPVVHFRRLHVGASPPTRQNGFTRHIKRLRQRHERIIKYAHNVSTGDESPQLPRCGGAGFWLKAPESPPKGESDPTPVAREVGQLCENFNE